MVFISLVFPEPETALGILSGGSIFVEWMGGLGTRGGKRVGISWYPLQHPHPLLCHLLPLLVAGTRWCFSSVCRLLLHRVCSLKSTSPFNHWLRSYLVPHHHLQSFALSQVPVCFLCSPTASPASVPPSFSSTLNINKDSFSHITLFEAFSTSVKKAFVISFCRSQKLGDLVSLS